MNIFNFAQNRAGSEETLRGGGGWSHESKVLPSFASFTAMLKLELSCPKVRYENGYQIQVSNFNLIRVTYKSIFSLFCRRCGKQLLVRCSSHSAFQWGVLLCIAVIMTFETTCTGQSLSFLITYVISCE